jgi:hypothetical protein
MNTLLLDATLWDLVTDAYGNIAVATDPYSVAQDVASACRVFQGEEWYSTNVGIPYFQQILGQLPSINIIKTLIANQAATVPGCNNPVVYLSAVVGRRLTGQIQFTDSNGLPVVISLSPAGTPFVLGQSILGGPDVI